MFNSLILDEIVSIEELEDRDTIDISVSDHNLFLANEILTHNSGFNNSDIEMSDISESAGTSMTVDFLIAVINTEELQEANQFLFKQLKNRYNDFTQNQKFVVGVDRAKMRLFNCENNAQIESISQKSEDAFADGAFLERNKEIERDKKFGLFDFD